MKTTEQIIIEEIARLFSSRNMSRVEGLAETWLDDLKDYNPIDIKRAFDQVRKYGNNFASLPDIIAVIEKRSDTDTQAIEAWASVRKAMKESSSKSLTPIEKEVMLMVSTGLSELMDADAFKLGQIERDYKKMYASAINGTSKHVKIESGEAVKQLTMVY